MLDPDMPRRAGKPSGLVRQRLEATNRTAEVAVSLFIQALCNYAMEAFASEELYHSLDNLQSEVIMIVPPTWSVKGKIAVKQVSLS